MSTDKADVFLGSSDAKDDLEVDGSKLEAGKGELKSSKIAPNTWTRRDELNVWKNVMVIGFGFMFLFTAFQNMAALQSSLNPSDGIGVYTLAIIYATIILSCFFLPTIFIKTLKVKLSLVVCQAMYTLYIAAQFYPKWGTLIPSSILLGLAAAPMWSAKCTYLSQMGTYVAKVKGTSSEVLINRFFGIFFCMFQTWGIWGNIVTATVLAPKSDWMEPDAAGLAQCGANFKVVHDVVAEVTDKGGEVEEAGVAKEQVYMLAGIYLVFAIIGPTIIFFFLDPLSKYGEDERKEQKGKSGVQLLMATFSHFAKNKYQMLIMPITIWSGLEQGWFGASFTAAFITCPIGVHNIGYIIIVYASTDAICSFLFGWILKRIGRIPVFLMAAVFNMSVILILLHWTPTVEHKAYLYLFAILWGMGDAVWQTQINAFYGVIFPGQEEPAFSNYRLWESLGFLAAYLIGNNIVLSTFMWILVGWLSVSFVGYIIIEVLEYKRTGHYSIYLCDGGKTTAVEQDH
ncbi:protein unc-93 homolog A-like isoform X2 [Bolinopsis microptera]|uniref:protein unc-93 homolog A-like isoform X2 n=1 Tax=Bolinopsis microptera TaxID=2820187 RepID=UPI00307AB012